MYAPKELKFKRGILDQLDYVIKQLQGQKGITTSFVGICSLTLCFSAQAV